MLTCGEERSRSCCYDIIMEPSHYNHTSFIVCRSPNLLSFDPDMYMLQGVIIALWEGLFASVPWNPATPILYWFKHSKYEHFLSSLRAHNIYNDVEMPPFPSDALNGFGLVRYTRLVGKQPCRVFEENHQLCQGHKATLAPLWKDAWKKGLYANRLMSIIWVRFFHILLAG